MSLHLDESIQLFQNFSLGSVSVSTNTSGTRPDVLLKTPLFVVVPPNTAGKCPDLSLKVSSGVWKQEQRFCFGPAETPPPSSPPADMKGSRAGDGVTGLHGDMRRAVQRTSGFWQLHWGRWGISLLPKGTSAVKKAEIHVKFADKCKDPDESRQHWREEWCTFFCNASKKKKSISQVCVWVMWNYCLLYWNRFFCCSWDLQSKNPLKENLCTSRGSGSTRRKPTLSAQPSLL